MPPTASKEPAACRDPEAEIAARELAPGEPKKNELELRADADVRKPVATKSESSGDVKAVPDIDAEAGLAFMIEMYFTICFQHGSC